MTHTNISRALRSLDSREEEPCSGWREACSGVAVGAREHIGHSDSGVESQGLQRTSWGGAVSLQILKQDIKLWSLLCEVGHTLHSPGLPASSEVSWPLKAEFLILRATDILGWIILFGGCCPAHIIEHSAASLTSIY